MSENEVAALAVVCIFGMPVFSYVITRIMKHMERMEMIKHGMIPPENGAKWAETINPTQAPPPPPGAQMYVPHPSMWNSSAQTQLRKGVVTSAIGLALFIGLGFIGARPDGTYVLGPWLLGGLIPLFVGLAQIANAMLSGALPRPNVTVGPIPPPPPGSPPPPPGSGPYAYRPGPTEELPRSKPPQTQ